jgi:multidrug efflux system membrane fusion protein
MRVIHGGTVKPGENVVVDGLQRIIPGVPVTAQVIKVDENGMPVASQPSPQPSAESKKN